MGHIGGHHTYVKIYRRPFRRLFKKTFFWVCPHCNRIEETTKESLPPEYLERGGNL